MFLHICRSKCKEKHVSRNARSIHKKNLGFPDVYEELFYQNKSDTSNSKFDSRRNKRFFNGKKEIKNGTIPAKLPQTPIK